MTTYQYDEDGRLVSSVTIREPEFSDWDRAILLDDHAKQNVRRNSLGLPLSETTDPKNQFAYRGKPPITDWAEKAQNEFIADYKKKWPNADTSALLWTIERLPVAGEEELGATEG